MNRPNTKEMRDATRHLSDVRSKWVNELIDYLENIEAEIARHHKDFERWEAMADKGAAHLAENAKLREEVEQLRTRSQLLENSGQCLAEAVQNIGAVFRGEPNDGSDVGAAIRNWDLAVRSGGHA